MSKKKCDQSLTPIFIFSMPRAGSTLLQRMLASHEQIASSAEPWVLLPAFYARRSEGIYTDYAQFKAVKGIEGFLEEVDGGGEAYDEALREFVLSLYRHVASKSKAIFFLDKTPRYHLVVDEIIRVFPDAKFIFLWRNPLSIVTSMVETWTPNYWGTFKYNIDLYVGIKKLTSACSCNREKVVSVHYEELLAAPESVLQNLCRYIGITYSPEMLAGFDNVTFQGRLGDPVGVHAYKQLSTAPLDKWKSGILNPYRKSWCKRYLNWLGQDVLAEMGYSLPSLLGELDRVPIGIEKLPTDIVMGCYGWLYTHCEPRLMRDKFKSSYNSKAVIHG